jgi:hypothetical protein
MEGKPKISKTLRLNICQDEDFVAFESNIQPRKLRILREQSSG